MSGASASVSVSAALLLAPVHTPLGIGSQPSASQSWDCGALWWLHNGVYMSVPLPLPLSLSSAAVRTEQVRAHVLWACLGSLCKRAW